MERRAFSRVLVAIEATIRRGNRILTGQVVNAGLKGIYIRTAQKLAVSDEVELALHPPHGQTGFLVTCRGVVLRVDSAGMAVELREMSREAFVQWKDVLCSQSSDPQRMEEELRRFISGR